MKDLQTTESKCPCNTTVNVISPHSVPLTQGLLPGCVTRAAMLRRNLCLVSCSAFAVLKFFIIFEQTVQRFYFALGLPIMWPILAPFLEVTVILTFVKMIFLLAFMILPPTCASVAPSSPWYALMHCSCYEAYRVYDSCFTAPSDALSLAFQYSPNTFCFA